MFDFKTQNLASVNAGYCMKHFRAGGVHQVLTLGQKKI